MTDSALNQEISSIASERPGMYTLRLALANTNVRIGGSLLLIVILMSIFAPLLTSHGPLIIDPINRLAGVSADHPFGTDHLGRDVFSRVLYGGQVSLLVGLSVAIVSVSVGTLVGLVAGYFSWVDAIAMRAMDGLMAIPAVLLAIALVALSGGGLVIIVVAIAIPEIPRVVRLVRGIVLSVRNEPYVEAALTTHTPTHFILWRHILPNTMSPLLVQTTYICSAAIILEAILSFLGAGMPPEIPSWGNMISGARLYFQISPGLIFFPGVMLTATVLAINILGDGLRDTLDPKMMKRV